MQHKLRVEARKASEKQDRMINALRVRRDLDGIHNRVRTNDLGHVDRQHRNVVKHVTQTLHRQLQDVLGIEQVRRMQGNRRAHHVKERRHKRCLHTECAALHALQHRDQHHRGMTDLLAPRRVSPCSLGRLLVFLLERLAQRAQNRDEHGVRHGQRPQRGARTRDTGRMRIRERLSHSQKDGLLVLHAQRRIQAVKRA